MDFELLGQRHISNSSTWAYLAVCGDEVVVRDLQGLTARYWHAMIPENQKRQVKANVRFENLQQPKNAFESHL